MLCGNPKLDNDWFLDNILTWLRALDQTELRNKDSVVKNKNENNALSRFGQAFDDNLRDLKHRVDKFKGTSISYVALKFQPNILI